jgi:hypothetical protein
LAKKADLKGFEATKDEISIPLEWAKKHSFGYE